MNREGPPGKGEHDMTNPIPWNDSGLLEEVQQRSGTQVSACFQCHKCSTGCPIGPDMDFLPSQVMRLVHLGAENEVLASRSIWLCASCEACTTRCPMAIDIAGVMDALRIMAIDRRTALPDAHGKQFHRSFLGSVRRHGRVYEVGMMAAYKLRTFDLFSDVDKVPRMLAQGKLSLLPNRSGSIKEVREIFRRAEEEDRKP
jgi:heterodisulfide reductase subunit C2